MKIEKVFEGIRYRLSNENLKVGDKVFSILNGRTLSDGTYLLHNVNFKESCSGFPNEYHTIKEIITTETPNRVITDMGYSPIDVYFKIIKKEKQVMDSSGLFIRYSWVDIPISEIDNN